LALRNGQSLTFFDAYLSLLFFSACGILIYFKKHPSSLFGHLRVEQKSNVKVRKIYVGGAGGVAPKAEARLGFLSYLDTSFIKQSASRTMT
jgi:hypothetical protein